MTQNASYMASQAPHARRLRISSNRRRYRTLWTRPCVHAAKGTLLSMLRGPPLTLDDLRKLPRVLLQDLPSPLPLPPKTEAPDQHRRK